MVLYTCFLELESGRRQIPGACAQPAWLSLPAPGPSERSCLYKTRCKAPGGQTPKLTSALHLHMHRHTRTARDMEISLSYYDLHCSLSVRFFSPPFTENSYCGDWETDNKTEDSEFASSALMAECPPRFEREGG